MAWEQKGFCNGTLAANASMASNQFKCVKPSSNNVFKLCDTDGEIFLGVLQDNPGSGEAGQIMMMGITKVVAAETLTAGNTWGTGASATAKLIEGTRTGADIGDFAAGLVLVGASANELATVTVGLHTFKVEAN